MKNSSCRPRLSRLVACVHGERLFLAPDLRSGVIAEMRLRISRAACGDPSESCSSDFRSAPLDDRRAFAESVAFERLGELYLCLGSRPGAIRAFRDAALATLGGVEYDHGSESLPARFLRIRFYNLLDRLHACCGGDERFRILTSDALLAMEARRLGGEFL